MALKDVDIGVKILGGLVALGLAIALLSDGDPENDSWTEDEAEADDALVGYQADDVRTEDSPGDADDDGSPAEDDAWTRGSPDGGEGGDDGDGDGGSGDEDGDGEPDPPPDDPWTRGAPERDSDDGAAAGAPADDPWTRGRPEPSGRRGLPPCVGTMLYRTADGRVGLPTDRAEEAFASADCALGPGRSGDAVSLVQVALNACNGQAVEVTAVHDEATAQALAAVQSRHGLAADGVYGPATREAMAWPTEPDGGGPVTCMSNPGIG